MSAIPESMLCYVVRKTERGALQGGIERRPLSELPAGDVLIRVAYSSLNYKDALASSGHPGVVKALPHVPGIDAAGVVAHSDSPDVRVGDEVLVTGYDLGAGRWGGWAEYIRVPAEWVVPLPAGMSPHEAMACGTAGFTAGLSVAALERHGIAPGDSEVVVTGATGGVGSLAVALLAKLGYRVAAVTGKSDRAGWLRELGAGEVLGRDAVDDRSSKPLLAARWAGGVDTVGGNTLATLLRATRPDGCITACGLVGGDALPLSVYPFILRGVVLAGVDSAWQPRRRRLELWPKLAGPWKLDRPAALVATIPLAAVGEAVQKILKGDVTGRIVVQITDAAT